MADGVKGRARDALASPIYDPLRQWLERLPQGQVPGPDELNAFASPALVGGGGVPLRFIMSPKERARTYAEQFEVRAWLRGEMPVREGSWHDLFNALAWLAFPRTKAAINRCHYLALEQERLDRGVDVAAPFSPGGRRSATRDALTLLDESGILVVSDCEELLTLIRSHQWKELFWTRRADVSRHMRFFVLGHALHEKAMHAYKGMTARAWLACVPASFLDLAAAAQLAEVDRLAAKMLGADASTLTTNDLSPLPLMGIPGWAENDAPAFYEDALVFR